MAGEFSIATAIARARNDHASIQLPVRSGAGIADLKVEVETPLEAVARWVDYVPVGSNPSGTPTDEVIRSAPALFPDPLREDFPLALRANTTQAIWITVYAAAGAEPGEYSGQVTLSSGDERLASESFQASVAEATVPAEQALKVTNWFNLGAEHLGRHYSIKEDSDEYWELLGNIGRVMADHKQNVMLTPVS